jgi:hypothetical protein
MVSGPLMELDDHNCWTIAEAAGHRGPQTSLKETDRTSRRCALLGRRLVGPALGQD